MAENQNEIEKYFSDLEKLEKGKQELIKKLLDERDSIDEQLKKLGHGGGAKKGRPQGAGDVSKFKFVRRQRKERGGLRGERMVNIKYN
jgi:hypothetical protein